MKHKIKDRIIPCPKYIKAEQGYSFYRNRIEIIHTSDNPQVLEGVKLLSHIPVTAYIKPDFIIRLRIVDFDDVFPKLDKNAIKEEAYMIRPVLKDKIYSGLELLAYTETGLYYACATLSQAITVISENEVDIPLLEITDWPSIRYRGLFLGDYHKNLEKTSLLKLNALDFVYLSSDEQSAEDIYEKCRSLGITVFTAIFEWKDPMQSILDAAVENKKSNIVFWISDELDAQQFIERTEQILNAVRKIDNKDISIGIITNYKGDEAFEKLLSLDIPENFTISYCDKEKTYDTDLKDITHKKLASYAQKKGLVGVYPLIGYDISSFFPWTAPEYVLIRSNEMARNNIHKVMAYTPFICAYSEFNYTALAEWLWNPKGRNTIEFVKAYALRNNLDFDSYENALYYLTFAQWRLQRSKLIQCITKEQISFENLQKLPRINQMVSDVKKALRYARQSGDDALVSECHCVLQALYVYISVKKLTKLVKKKKQESNKYKKYYELMEKSSKSCYAALVQWSDNMKEKTGHHDPYVMDTAKAFFNLSEQYKED